MVIFITFLICIVLLNILLHTSFANFGLDHPNERSLHTRLTPRTGGVAVMTAILASWIFIAISWIWLVLPLCLVIISFIDDIYHLSVRWRLLVHFVVGAIFVMFIAANIPWWLGMLAVFFLTWMTNLYNFMDGSDGLAGGMGIFGFSSYALSSYLAGDIQLAMMCASVSASCFAFLTYNFYPAKIFMGDSGSIPLGFLAGAVGFYGFVNGNWQAWFPLLVFSPFIVDATVTLFKRLLRGEKLSEAHRSHYYQRLVQMGWGHRKTALIEYGLMLASGLSAIVLLESPLHWVIVGVGFWALVYIVLMSLIDHEWAKMQKTTF